MKLLYIASPLAVAAVLALSPVAYADTMVGGKTFTDAQMTQVRDHCTTLSTQGANAGRDDKGTAPGETSKGTGGGGGEAATDEMDALTLEDCQAAGLGQ